MFQLEETTEITQLLVTGCLTEDSSRPGQVIVWGGGGREGKGLVTCKALTSYAIQHPILRGPCSLSLFRFQSPYATETKISSGCVGFLGKEQLSFKPIWTQTGMTFLSRKYIRKDKKVRACCSDKHAKKADKPILMHLTFCFHIMHLQEWLLNKITIKSKFRSSKVNVQTEKIWNLLTIKVNIAGKD